MKTKHVLLCTSAGVFILGLRILSHISSSVQDTASYHAYATSLQMDAGIGTLQQVNWLLQQQNIDSPTKLFINDSFVSAAASMPAINQTQQQTRAIFYNVFIPPRYPIGGMKIVREQLQQIRQADGHEESIIYYNIIGGTLPSNTTLCSDKIGVEDKTSRCQQLGYYKQAQEVVTLQDLYEYCVKHPTHHVTYLHDKGSFHPKVGVDRSRRIGTRGALACLLDDNGASVVKTANDTIPLQISPCSVCADAFTTHPHTHIPGNIFAAQCRYIVRLVPPEEYEQSRRNICTFMHQHGISANPRTQTTFCPTIVTTTAWKDSNTTSRALTKDTFAKEDVGYGFGRYAMERWVVSHPTLHVCTVFHNTSKNDFQTGWEYWQPQPLSAQKKGRRTSEDSRRNLLFLVYEYAHLYNVTDWRLLSECFLCQTYFPQARNACPLPSKKYRAALAGVSSFVAPLV